jgi:hypothetical protein
LAVVRRSFGHCGTYTSLTGHLEFDVDLIFDDQVDGLFADNHVAGIDHDSPLPHDAEPKFSYLVSNET